MGGGRRPRGNCPHLHLRPQPAGLCKRAVCALTGLQGCVVAAPAHGHRRRLRARLPDPARSVMARLPPFWTPGRRPAPGPAEGSLLPPRCPRRPWSLALGIGGATQSFHSCPSTSFPGVGSAKGTVWPQGGRRPVLASGTSVRNRVPLRACPSCVARVHWEPRAPHHPLTCGSVLGTVRVQKPEGAPAATAVGASAAWTVV